LKSIGYPLTGLRQASCIIHANMPLCYAQNKDSSMTYKAAYKVVWRLHD